MKKGSTLFLRGVIVVLAIAVLALCIFGLPVIMREVGEFVPEFTFLRYLGFGAIYLAAIGFYITLYQGFKLLHYIDKNVAFSELSVAALKTIKYATASMTLLYALALPLAFVIAEKDDAPGLIIMWMAFAGSPLIIAVFASVLEKLFKNAVDIKTENDLMV